MRVVVTGATGFIGRTLCHRLTASEHEAVALTRNPGRAAGLLGERVRCLGWDGDLAGCLEGADAIVNLAGENVGGGRWSSSLKEAILKSRVDAGSAITEAARRLSRKPSVIIQGSAVGFYGSRGDEVLDEASPAGDDFLVGVCQAWEASTEPLEAMGVRRAIVRTGVVLGLGGGALPRLVAPFRFYAGGPLGKGDQWFPWIHLEDEVQAIQFLIENDGARGVFHLTSPEPLQMRDFCRVLGRVMKRPSWMQVPAFALRLLFGEMADSMLLASQRTLPGRLIEAGFQFEYPNAEVALRSLLESNKS